MTTPALVIIDDETRSEKRLGKKDGVGAWRYAEDPSTSLLCKGYKVIGQDDRPKLWTPEQPFPQELIDHAESGSIFVAHNVQFERAIWWYQLTHKLDIPSPKRWLDTMAICAHRGLPLGLDEAGAVLEMPIQKDKRGKYLIQRLCKRHKPSKKWPDGWVNDAKLLTELYDYCLQDVDAEHTLLDTLGFPPEDEYWLWAHYEEINARGLYADMEAVRAAQSIVTQVKDKLGAELIEVTNGAVQDGNKLPAMKAFLADHGCTMDSLNKDAIEAELKNDDLRLVSVLPAICRRVLELRQQLSASTTKLDAFERCVMSDGFIRGTQQYHGTAPGRTAGRLIQPTNMTRWESKTLSMEGLIDAIKTRDPEKVREAHGDPLQAVADAQRGYIIAKPGHEFLVTDFSAIQAVGTAWLAGEQWKLDAFETIQRGEKYQGADDIYCAAAAGVFGRPVSKKENPEERQVGKVCELAFGFEGGVGAWRGFDKSDKYSDSEIHGFKLGWRKKHPMTQRLWRELKRACGLAILNPGQRWVYRHIAFETVDDAAGHWLTMILPSGRRIWYFNPDCEVEDTPFGPDYVITCEGRDNKRGGTWGTIYLYGGLLTENAAMGIERDLLTPAMRKMEAAGYPIVLTVYDEAVAQVPIGYGSQDEFDAIMRDKPAWAAGMPVATAGWRGTRYKKG